MSSGDTVNQDNCGVSGAGSRDMGEFAPPASAKQLNRFSGMNKPDGALAAWGGSEREKKSSNLESGPYGANPLNIDMVKDYPMVGEGASSGPTAESAAPRGDDSKPKASGVGRAEDN